MSTVIIIHVLSNVGNNLSKVVHKGNVFGFNNNADIGPNVIPTIGTTNINNSKPIKVSKQEIIICLRSEFITIIVYNNHNKLKSIIIV